MKYTLQRTLSVLIAALMILSVLPMTAFAEEEDLCTYTVTDGKAVITGANEALSGDITIPSTLGGYRVVGIGKDAFNDNKGIKNVVIPDGIEYIGDEAFCDTTIETLTISATVKEMGKMLCLESKLREYAVDEDNPYFSSDEYGVLYNKDRTKLLDYPCLSPYTSYTVPDTVEIIGAHSFSSQFTVKEIIMPDSVKEIENEVFYGCSALERVRLSENLQTIGDQNFYFCYALRELSIPASVKLVGEESFIDLYGLDSVKIYTKDADFSNSLLGFLELGSDDNDRFELSAIYVEFSYLYYCVGDKEKADEIGQQLYNYEFTEENYAHSYPVYCYKGSKAEEYALAHGLECFYMCESHVPGVIEAVDATCIEGGFSEGSECTVCGEILIAPEEIPAKGHTLGQWINDYDRNMATRYCEGCDYSESKELTEQGDGDVEIIAPSDPDLNFDVDSVEKNNKTFLLAEQAIAENSEAPAEVIKVFDISLKNDKGVNVQPDGTVKVKLPLDWEGDKIYKVYRVNEDGTLTLVAEYTK